MALPDLVASNGRPLCDLCSDPVETSDVPARHAGRVVHRECATEADRAAA